MHRSLLALALLGAFAASASAQVQLQTDWDATFQEATERNIPVLFLLGREGKTPWKKQQFTVPGLVKFLNDRVLVLVAHRPGGHKPTRRTDRTTKQEVDCCPVYPELTCEVHEAFDHMAGNYDFSQLPTGFLLGPDAKAVASEVHGLAPKQMIAKIEQVQLALGAGVSRAEIDGLERRLKKGDAKLAGEKFKAARKVYEKPLKQKKPLKPYLKRIVEARLEQLDAKALEAIEAARSFPAKRRHDALKRIAREMKGRPPAEQARAVLAETEGS